MERKVKIESVSKYFKNNSELVPVIDGISFDIGESEIVCIVGPSGCGKSTLINLIAGFSFPEKGKIFANSKVVSRPEKSRTVIFQENSLFPWKTIEKNIAFGLQNKSNDEKNKIVGNLINKIGLEKFAQNYPNEISRGMKQKVSLMRAFAAKPEIILMDEPFASLDQQSRYVFQEELLKFKEEFKTTILFVTHDIEEALFLADRIILLTARPAKIREIIKIPFERPRLLEIRTNQEFIKLKNYIYNSLREISR